MGNYITVVRRMSMIDLFDRSHRNEMMETQEGVEVVNPAKAGRRGAGTDEAGIPSFDLGSDMLSSTASFSAMEAA